MLTFTILWKKSLTFHANCLQKRQYAWTAMPIFWKKKISEKILSICRLCWNFIQHAMLLSSFIGWPTCEQRLSWYWVYSKRDCRVRHLKAQIIGYYSLPLGIFVPDAGCNKGTGKLILKGVTLESNKHTQKTENSWRSSFWARLAGFHHENMPI